MRPTRQDWNPLEDYEPGEILYFLSPGMLLVGKVSDTQQDVHGHQYAIFEGPVWHVLEKQAKGLKDKDRGPVEDEYDILDGGPMCISGIPELKIGRAAELWPNWNKKPWTSVKRV